MKFPDSRKCLYPFLNGLRILDFSSLLPAPFAAHLLARMGAEVIKIESPNRLDPAREFGFSPPGKTSSCYREINDIKKLVLLDLKSDADRKKLYELVKTSDGGLEGYRPEVRKRLGIDYETLSKINPKFVYTSLLGFDPSGPQANRAGHDINFVARSGILDQTRGLDGNCVLPGLPLADYIIGYAAAFRMCAGLLASARTQKGCHIEVSIEEALIEVQKPFLREALESGHMPKAGHSLITGRYPCYNLYHLDGGTFALGALEPKFWELFCISIDRKDLIPKQFSKDSEAKTVINEVHKTLKAKSFTHWKEVFSQVDCCIEPVFSVEDVLNGLQSSRFLF